MALKAWLKRENTEAQKETQAQTKSAGQEMETEKQRQQAELKQEQMGILSEIKTKT